MRLGNFCSLTSFICCGSMAASLYSSTAPADKIAAVHGWIYNFILKNKKVISHTRTVVRECFKGDEASQWKRPKFDPSPHQNPLTDLHKNWQA